MIHIHDKNGKSFVRSWDFDRYGEDLKSFRPTIQKVVTTKKAVVAFEFGQDGIMLRAIVPIFDNNNNAYVGSLEFLQGVGSVSRDMEEIGRTYALLINKDNANKFKNISQNKRIDDYYLANDTWFSDAVVNKIAKIDFDVMFDKGYYISDECFFTSIPLKTFNGNVIGYHIIGLPKEVVRDSINHSMSIAYILSAISATGFLLVFISLFLFNRLVILKPLGNMVKNIEKIASGDFTEKLDIKSNDELGVLSKSINKMSEQISDALTSINTSSLELYKISNELTAVSKKIAEGTETQSSNITSLASAIEEISTSIKEVANNASNVSEAAEIAEEAVVSGNELATKTSEIMKTVTSTVEDSANTVTKLGESSEKIGNIIQVIKDIAEQTNLLALNAAIEAARAGEHGRGFAVVADEVKKLANKTVNATKEITDMVSSIQVETNEAVNKMHDIVDHVKNGRQISEETNAALDKIMESVKSVSMEIGRVAIATREQSAALEMFEKNMAEIENVSLSNRQTAAETSKSLMKLKICQLNLKIWLVSSEYRSSFCVWLFDGDLI